ncbi:Agmatine deiminase [Pseudomonas chlororaphis]|uniref:Agmatine deiminase n=2 Tax=Pseudomonas chlororaphis TaxID=587753 RepID=A0A3G7TMR1_9PSED|nr:Agmatine deiminase [Pseudomonas chlororaphis]
MVWPHDRESWRGFGVTLESVREDVARVAHAIRRFEPVNLVVHPDDMFCAERLCEPTIKLIPLSVNDSWCRDTGPTFICHARHGVAGINWGFNGWGGKARHELDATLGRRILETQGLECLFVPLINEGGAIHVDGEGTLITTESVLLNANRNHGMDRLKVEEYFRLCLGVEKTIWLPGDPNDVTGDFTDGHVDGICAFARPGVLLLESTRQQATPYAEVFRENRRALELARDARGRKFELVPLYEAEGVESRSDIFCASYSNFYITNGGVVMPSYGVASDQLAADTVQRVFPDRTVVQVSINKLAQGGGGIHCMTQQQPAWPL